MSQSLPTLALSVRRPWAWAILHGGKVIENRTLSAIRAGGMTTGAICLHAASGMKEDEYRWGLWRLAKHGVVAPRPDALIRSAIIGTIDVVDIVTESDSAWFGGKAGLVLENPVAIEPIPAKGALGYFAWQQAGSIAKPSPWMLAFDRAGGTADTPSLFPKLPVSFEEPPKKPFG
ncbi:MAG: hypothetical protein AAGK92_07620 [Pseudomonadota bacterium]